VSLDRFLGLQKRKLSVWHCYKCDVDFYRREDMRIHMRNKHGVRFEEAPSLEGAT